MDEVIRKGLAVITDVRNGYMVKQIAVSKNAKRIIETVNSLHLASIYNAEKIHALSEINGDQGNGRRVYSRIKLRIINIEQIENVQLEFNLT